MAAIIFLFLVLAADSLVNGQECRDVLGHCNVVKANCESPQAETQMRRLCAKTCGFCTPTKAAKKKFSKSNKSEAEIFTLEVFLLYLKNDIKFLKEEISDVKLRLRGIETRKQTVVEVPKQDPRLAVDITELKYQTERLSSRIQDQTSRFSKFISDFSGNLLNAKHNFTGEIGKIQRDIFELSEDLKRDAQKIQSLSTFDDELQDVKENMSDMTKQSQATIASFSNYFRNLSATVADRFLKLQDQFYKVLNDERVKVIDLGVKIENVTNELYTERARTKKLERFVDEFSSLRFTEILEEDKRRIDALTVKYENISKVLGIQAVKTSMLTALVDELTKKPSLVTFDEERAAINQLQSKFNYVLRRLELQIRKTTVLQTQLNNTRVAGGSTSGGSGANTNSNPQLSYRMDVLTRKLNQVSGGLEALKIKTAKSGVSESFQKLFEQVNKQSGGSGGSSSAQKWQIVNELSVDVEQLKKQVQTNSDTIEDLETKVEEVSTNSTSSVRGIKVSIESMASLRNNESFTIAEISSKYQQGIMSLLGPQQGNGTRFFKPRFDWEGGRLSIYGYIAINREGEWGTICDDSFDEKEAEVLCRMAGYKGGVYDNGKYKIGDGLIGGKGRTDYRIWIDELRCEGTELSIEDCRHGSEGWGIHDCDHGEDVGIKCFVA